MNHGARKPIGMGTALIDAPVSGKATFKQFETVKWPPIQPGS